MVLVTPDLVGDDLLGAQGDGDGFLAGQGQRLVHAVGVQALRAAQHRRQRLDGHAHDVVFGLLGGERCAGGLGVGAQQPGAGILGAITSPASLRAQMRRAARYLAISSKKSLWALKKKESRGAKSSMSRPRSKRRIDVGEPVGQGEGQFLRGGGAGLADVIAADADGVPLAAARWCQTRWCPMTRRIEGSGGKMNSFWAMYSLRMSFWIVPRSWSRRHALFLRRHDVHRPEHGRGRVDRHAGADIVQGDAVEEDFHVGQGGDGHAASAEFAQRFGGVAVVALQRGHVEGDGKAHVALFEQIFDSAGWFLRRSRSPRTCAWSTACPGTWCCGPPACKGIRPGIPRSRS